MRQCFLNLIIFVSLLTPSWAQDFQRSVITDPGLSRRCEMLIQERQRKISHKQRLDSLLIRNQQVLKLTPENKLTLKRRLESHQSRVKQEQRLSLVQIQHLEERIVRQGCPGIRL